MCAMLVSSTIVRKAAQAPKAEFKPRHLNKKGTSGYRDRAAERREGAAGDFAEVRCMNLANLWIANILKGRSCPRELSKAT